MGEWRTIRDGNIFYVPDYFAPSEANDRFAWLRSAIPWTQGSLRGRPLPRLNAWFAAPGLRYRYSGLSHDGRGWLPELISIKQQVELVSGTLFNSVLLNRYRHGQDSIGFHADAEPELGINPPIATLSFGSEREFILKHNVSKETITYRLPHGSLLVMGGSTQHYWVHAVPKTKAGVGERISLTFRYIFTPGEQPI